MIGLISSFVGARPLAGIGAALVVGFALGAAWLTFVGVPVFNILPSYLDVRLDAGQAVANEEAITDSFETSEDRRTEERDVCRIAVAEAVASEARRCAQIQGAAAAFRNPEGENPDNELPDPVAAEASRCVDVQLVPTRGLRGVAGTDRDSPAAGASGG